MVWFLLNRKERQTHQGHEISKVTVRDESTFFEIVNGSGVLTDFLPGQSRFRRKRPWLGVFSTAGGAWLSLEDANFVTNFSIF